MSEPWTPGPWEYHYWNDGDARSAHLIRANRGTHLQGVGMANEAADARLIAAAPEMAALLEGLKVFDPTERTANLLRRIRGDPTEAP